MTPEQKAVVLDAAQEMQGNDTWWECFEWKREWESVFSQCSQYINPVMHYDDHSFIFRRKPKTITVTMPVPHYTIEGGAGEWLSLRFLKEADRDKALAAIRKEMGDE